MRLRLGHCFPTVSFGILPNYVYLASHCSTYHEVKTRTPQKHGFQAQTSQNLRGFKPPHKTRSVDLQQLALRVSRRVGKRPMKSQSAGSGAGPDRCVVGTHGVRRLRIVEVENSGAAARRRHRSRLLQSRPCALDGNGTGRVLSPEQDAVQAVSAQTAMSKLDGSEESWEALRKSNTCRRCWTSSTTTLQAVLCYFNVSAT